MLHRIHQKLGTVGVIVAVVALIAALGGTALAASGGLSGKQKKEVEKIAKKYAGKPGAPGVAGTNGKDGSAGAKGENGTNGSSGKSVTVTDIPSGEPECAEQGGALVEQEGAISGTEVCNGTTGFTEALPPKKTETGTWVANSFGLAVHNAASGVSVLGTVPISFPIPLAEASEQSYIFTTEQVEGEEGGFEVFASTHATGCEGRRPHLRAQRLRRHLPTAHRQTGRPLRLHFL